MIGVDAAVITAFFAGLAVLIGAIAGGIIKIVHELNAARAERGVVRDATVDAAHEAKDAATAAKQTASAGVDDIRQDLQVVVLGLTRLDGRFSSLERKVVGLGKDQSALLGIVANVDAKTAAIDEKVDVHIAESRAGHGA